ncbi:MAG: cytochrome-c peroxidase [Bacteroidetes bacterium]|nr:cytochrome-c peroxidase [Bacteroidota bacterium]
MLSVNKLLESEEWSGGIYKRYFSRGLVLIFISGFVWLASCKKDPIAPVDDTVSSCGTPLNLKLPDFFPPMRIPKDNPLTEEGVELGRHLFYEKMLSGDHSQSCASCHHQNRAFTDSVRLSVGIDGVSGFRQAMPIANLAYSPKFFWDGKATSLEQQILFPIQAQFEMHQDLFEAVRLLQESEKYPGMFYAAFCDSAITVDHMAKALAQFMRTILSYNFKSAPGSVGESLRNPFEQLGFDVFTDPSKGDCFHCHSVSIFTTNFEFANNGLVDENNSDQGLYGQTGNPNDKGKFKVPSLLNLVHTAPYMHDGRFNTLEEVLNFYDTGFHITPTLDVTLISEHTDGQGHHKPRAWSDQEKQALVYFLKRLTDDAILTEEKYSDPNK